jgi:hypothetical protein
MIIDSTKIEFIDLKLPPATSKFCDSCNIENQTWFIPYGIWDDFNYVVELSNFIPTYHKIEKNGKGMFYSVASNNETAFSFPLGYEGDPYCLFINDNKISTIDLSVKNANKLHMGTVYCNEKYWSAPRGDSLLGEKEHCNYHSLLSFDGTKIEEFPLKLKDNTIPRKYSDLLVKENVLYALPYGEKNGVTEILEFNTETNDTNFYQIENYDFAKKYNSMVLIGDYIISLPYGDEAERDSNYGIQFNTKTKSIEFFDIGEDLSFGGKYRFRTGNKLKNTAIFVPSGTANCPIMSIDEDLNLKKCELDTILFGRPIVHENFVKVIGVDLYTQQSYLFMFDEHLNYEKIIL